MKDKPKVVVTRKLPEACLNLFNGSCRLHIWESEDVPMPYEQILTQIADADAVLTNVSDRIDKALIETGVKLKVISTMAVGFDNIDIEIASRRGIYVGHTPDVLTEAVADLTFALMLGTARRIVEGMSFIKEDRWKSWGPMLLTGPNVWGAKLGIIGMGRIGEAVARRATGFGMNILYCNRNRKLEAEKEHGATFTSLEGLLSRSDYVVMLAPSNTETFRMLGDREFRLMKPGSIFINTARGTNVDEEALFRALKERRIWGAGLDVFEQEPINSRHPFCQLDNVVLLPHIGSATIETRSKMAELAALNILKVLGGEVPLYCVNQNRIANGQINLN